MDNILLIGAHFDDVELGVGGTAAKLVSEGKKVYKLTLTDNETHFSQMEINVSKQSSINQSALACRTLGIEEITDFNMVPCNHLTYSTELMQDVENVIYEKQIDTVFLHYTSDMNQDHISAANLCLTAARHCDNILQYQSNGYILDNAFYPTFFIDISLYVEKKKRALSCYGKEHNRFNRLFDTVIERNHIWGYANKVEYAEGFKVVKMISR